MIFLRVILIAAGMVVFTTLALFAFYRFVCAVEEAIMREKDL